MQKRLVYGEYRIQIDSVALLNYLEILVRLRLHPLICLVLIYRYHVCVNGSSINGTCPNGLNFNVRNQQCDFPNVINCLGPSTNGF